MAEKRVYLEPGKIYHIWTHANGNANLFLEEQNYHFFLKKYQYHVHPIVDTYAYCLMPNHLHLMVKINEEEEIWNFLKTKKNFDYKKNRLQDFEKLSIAISRQFSNLFNSYTQAYNKLFNRRGSLFIPNFKRKHINSDNYYGTCIAYIHNNPVLHGFVTTPGEWEFSSWHAYLQNKPTRIKTTDGLTWFGSKTEFYRIHREIIMEKMTEIFE
jgi:REP element-mobilizing transposase RayT